MDAFTYILIGLMLLGVFMMFSRSSKARKRDMEMQEKIVVGTKVMTGSGIRGEIIEINAAENSVILKTGTEENPCYMEFDRRAIAYLMSDVLKTLPAQAPSGLSVEESPKEEQERKVIQDKNDTLEEVEPPQN